VKDELTSEQMLRLREKVEEQWRGIVEGMEKCQFPTPPPGEVEELLELLAKDPKRSLVTLTTMTAALLALVFADTGFSIQKRWIRGITGETEDRVTQTRLMLLLGATLDIMGGMRR